MTTLIQGWKPKNFQWNSFFTIKRFPLRLRRMNEPRIFGEMWTKISRKMNCICTFCHSVKMGITSNYVLAIFFWILFFDPWEPRMVENFDTQKSREIVQIFTSIFTSFTRNVFFHFFRFLEKLKNFVKFWKDIQNYRFLHLHQKTDNFWGKGVGSA